MANGDPIIDYENALALVYDAQALTLKGLRANPNRQQERKLNKRLASLKVEEADLIAMIDALENEPVEDLPGPDPALVAEIARLSGLVEAETKRNLTAEGALVAAGLVLDSSDRSDRRLARRG